MEEKNLIGLSWRTLFRLIIAAGLAFVVYLTTDVVSAFFAAVVISLGLDPLVSFFEKIGLGRFFGTILVFLVIVMVFGGVLYVGIPLVFREAISFLEDFSATIRLVFGFQLDPNFIQELSFSLTKIVNFLNANNVSAGGAISKVFSEIVLIFMIAVITFYLSIEKNGTERLLKMVLPEWYEKPALTVFSRFKIKIRRWFGAQLALSFLVGTMVSAGLFLLKVKYPLFLGILAAVFEIVPVVGPVLAGAAAFMVAFSQSAATGFYVLIFFIVIQQLENHLLIPLIIGKTMKVHPVIVIVSLFAGGKIGGFIGILLSVPVAVMTQEILNYMEERKETKRGLRI